MEWKCSSGLGRVKHIAAEGYMTKELLQEWGCRSCLAAIKKEGITVREEGGVPSQSSGGHSQHIKALALKAKR
jgi:hypothetical protein